MHPPEWGLGGGWRKERYAIPTRPVLKALIAVVIAVLLASPILIVQANRTDARLDAAAGDGPLPDLTFAVMGDSQGAAFPIVVDRMLSQKPRFVVSVGDNIAGELAHSVSGFIHRWRVDMLDRIEPLLAGGIPFFFVLGNHDTMEPWNKQRIQYDRGLEAWRGLSGLPGPAQGGTAYYSFDVEDAHFVVLNGTQPQGRYRIDAAQMRWLANDLASTDRRWKFVFCHFYAYGAAYPFTVSNKDDLIDLLERHRVTAYICGHSHVYRHWRHNGVDYISTPSVRHGKTRGEDHDGSLLITVSSDQVRVSVYRREGNDSFEIPRWTGYTPLVVESQGQRAALK